jgi:hypothetical protein
MEKLLFFGRFFIDIAHLVQLSAVYVMPLRQLLVDLSLDLCQPLLLGFQLFFRFLHLRQRAIFLVK